MQPSQQDVGARAPSGDVTRRETRPGTLDPHPSASGTGRDDIRLDGGADAALARSREVLEALFGAPPGRAFHVRFWNGAIDRGRDDAPFTLVLNRRGTLRRMLLPPSELAIVEAYLSGDADVEGDLERAATIGDAINDALRSPRALVATARKVLALPRNSDDSVREARAADRLAAAGRAHDPSRDRVAVRYHYDVGNDFYALWLDERMVYSCAYFSTPGESLDAAQRAKLDLVCRKLRLLPGERFLDVGCGWGALVMHAAAKYGVRATGITLSERQAELARARIAAAGLEDRCTIEVRDYRELPASEQFDKIASVGMVEHVGAAKLGEYFAALQRVLAPGGLLLNHGIVTLSGTRPRSWRERAERRLWRRDQFISQYVFPDGDLCPLDAVIGAAEGAGFETRDVESLREHYVLTLRAWVDRLVRQRDRAIAIAGERTFRVWRLYMSASAHAFATASINVVQTLLSKPDASGRSSLPLTRRDLLVAARA